LYNRIANVGDSAVLTKLRKFKKCVFWGKSVLLRIIYGRKILLPPADEGTNFYTLRLKSLPSHERGAEVRA